MTAKPVSTEISPKDEQFNFARTRMPNEESTRVYYLDTGRAHADALAKHFRDAGRDPSELDLLDYASGYGRVTRWLPSLFRTVTAADLEEDMLAFQKQHHDVDGFIGPMEPERLSEHAKDYDVVFVYSLFTHLPEATWPRWLGALARLLRPGGSLVFSTHSYELFAKLAPAKFGDPATWVDDLLFWSGNETEGRLSAVSYGTTIVKPEFVRRAASLLSGFSLTRHYRMGEFDLYHDVYVLIRAQYPSPG